MGLTKTESYNCYIFLLSGYSTQEYITYYVTKQNRGLEPK